MGGNVFNDAKPIKQEYIKNTLNNYIHELERVFPKANIFDKFITVGSCGKVPISGDIDLAIDISHFKPISSKLKIFNIDKNEFKEKLRIYKNRARTSTIYQLKIKTLLYFIVRQLNNNSISIAVSDKIGIGSLFTTFNQYDDKNNKLNKRVQVDIMIGNQEWLIFSYFSTSYKSNIKGLHRTQLMLSLFAHKGFVFSHLYGVKNKKTQKIVATTVYDAINLLSNLYNIKFAEKNLNNYNDLHKFIQNIPDYTSVIDIYLKILDKTRTDIPYDLQSYWINNELRLNLTGKFLPKTSKLYKEV